MIRFWSFTVLVCWELILNLILCVYRNMLRKVSVRASRLQHSKTHHFDRILRLWGRKVQESRRCRGYRLPLLVLHSLLWLYRVLYSVYTTILACDNAPRHLGMYKA